MTIADDTTEPTAERPALSATYTDGPAFRRYRVALPSAIIVISAALGAISSIVFPLQLQHLEFTHHFTGADAGVDLQDLTNLKADVDAGKVVPTGEQRRLLDLLATFDAARASSLSVGQGIAFFLTMLVQPIVGHLSDRTRSTWGRRAPWIAAGAVAGAGATVAIRFSPTVGLLIAAFSVVQLAMGLAQGPLNATVADRVPESKLASVSSLLGLGLFLGALLGALIAGQLFAVIGANVVYPLAAAVLLVCLLFVVAAPDRPSLHLPAERTPLRQVLMSLVIALRDRDFAFVWAARGILLLGWSLTGTFGIYMLQSYVHPALSASEAARIAPIMGLVGLPLTLVALFTAARLSDRWGKRKPFVIYSSLGLAVSFVVPAVWPTLPAMFIQAAVAGVAIGAYYAVDVALFIDVLPDKAAAGRDLGLSNASTLLGMTLGPLAAGQVVALTGSYRLVWVIGLAVVLLAAVLIVPVRRAA